MMKRSTNFFIFLLLLCAMHDRAAAQAPANDDCSGAISLSTGTPVSDDNTNATDDDLSGLSSCGSTSTSYTFHHGVWYTVTPSGNGQLTIATCGSDFDTYLRVYEGTCGNFTCVNYNDDGCSPQSTISFAATSGTTYYVFLSGYHDDDYGAYTISATLTLPPANDDCSGAIAFPAIPTDGTCASVTANTAAATQSMSGCTGTADDDVWYSFVCPAGVDSLLFQNTSVSGSGDRVIQFFSGDCDDLTSIKCSDPESGGVGGLIAGNTYYFRIYTYGSGNSTEVSVCLKVVPPPPANDDCSGAVALTVNPDYNCGTVTNGTTESATASTETAPDCGSSGTNDDVWYSFVATNTNHRITLQNVSGSTDMATAVYSGTCGNLTEIDCSDPNTLDLSGLTVGDTYFIRVWTWSSTATTHASFDICVGTPPPPPANDDCSGATAITSLPYTNTQDAGSASQTGFVTACPSGMNNGVWYQVEGTGCQMTVSVDPDGWDPAVGIFSGDCSNLECIDRVDNAGSSGTETATFSTTAGTTYFINIGYYSSSTNGSEGPFDISVTEDCCPIPSDISINNITSANAIIEWLGNANSIIEYGPEGFTPGTGASAGTDGTVIAVTGSPYEIESLDQETDYDIYVRSDCGSGTYSDNSDVESFTTLGTPPANDDCSAATSLTVNPDLNCGAVTSGTTLNATASSETAPDCGASGTNDDVWFSFTATQATQTVSLQNVSGSTDMAMAVYSGTCGNLTEIDCSDPNTLDLSGLTVGDTYFIRVWTWSSSTTTSATFDICVGTPPPPPANDDCSGAIAFPAIPTDGTCASVTANTVSATQSMSGCTGTADDDVWYSFVCPEGVDSILFQNTSVSGSTDRVIQFFSGDCDDLTSIKCSDPESGGVGGLTPGNTYYLRVYTYGSGNSTEVSVCLRVVPPPPANDDCSGAVALTVNPDLDCGNITSGTTESASASAETAPNCGASGTNDDVWYSFVATQAIHTISLQNVSGSTDMAMAVYSGTCGNLTSLACSDPNTLTVDGLTAGQTYYVRVWTYSSTAATHASFDICVGTPPPPPANDDCSGAIAFPPIPTDGTCASVTANTVSATQSMSGCAGTADDDVWYSFVCPEGVDSLLFQNTSVSGSTDRVIQFFSGDCDDLTSIKCSDPESGGIGGLTPGNTYYLRIYTYGSGNSTEVSVCLKVVPPVPANDSCANAITLPCDGTLTGDNTTAADDNIPAVSCGSTSNGARKAVWYTITPTYSGDLTISTCGSAFDTYLRVFEGTCDNFTACAGYNDDDDDCGNNNSTVTFTAVAGTTYYILLGGYSTSSYGSFTITSTCPPPPPVDSVVVSTDGSVPATITTDDGTLQLEATVYPAEADQNVTWSIIPETGNATIDANGLVTATLNGTVWAKAVSASDNTMVDSIEITISNQVIPIDSLVVSTDGNVPATITTDGGTLQLVATVYPAGVDQNVTWSIIPETGNATIDANGLVTATLNGTVWAKAVSASDNTMTDSIEITISNQIVPVDSLVVATDGNVPATITTNAGTLQLVAAVYPAEADQNVTWSIIPETGNATIDANGLVTATTDGTVWAKAVSVSDNTMADSIEITISNQVVPVDSLVVTTDGNIPAIITTNEGSLQLTATVYPAEADQSVTWNIIPETGNATIDANGLVTATLNGTVWAKAVSASDNTMADSIEITISNQLAPPDSVVVGTDANLPPVITTVGGTLLMNAIVFPIDADQDVTWSIVPETGDAGITSGGLVTAISDGTVWAKAVSVYDPAKSDSLLITINQSTGVKQVEEAIGFRLYPNPTNNGLNLVIAKPHPELTVTITDASGREVMRKHYADNELNTAQQISVAQLSAGAYFLSVNGSGINFSTQFIKQ